MSNGNGETIKNWLPLVAMMCGLAVTWGSLQSQVSAHEDKIDKIEKKEAADTRETNLDRLKVAEVATRQEAIQDDVDDIKATLKEQDKKLDKIIEKLNEAE